MSSIENNKKQGLQPKPESLPHLLIKRNTSTYRKYSLSSNTLETMGKKIMVSLIVRKNQTKYLFLAFHRVEELSTYHSPC